MRIVTKLNIGVLAAFAASAIANYAVMHQTIKPHFAQIDQATSSANHKRVGEAVEEQLAKIRSSSKDWAYWDDLKNYVLGTNADEFSGSNLTTPSQTMDGLGIEYLSIRDANGREVWARSFDLNTKEALPELQSALLKLPFEHPYLKKIGGLHPLSGTVSTANGLALLAVTPIVSSDHTGEAVGTIWMATRIDEQLLKRLTGVDLQINPKTENVALASVLASAQSTEDNITTRTALTDITGQQSAELVVSTPRYVSKLGNAAIYSALWLMAISAATAIGTLWLLTHILVVSRVLRLKDHFGKAQDDGRLKRFAAHKSHDEFSELAASYNAMAGQVNRLRDTVASHQSCLHDLNEWAAGTLHNVRNSLSPINALAWSLKSSHPETWLINVRAAASELATPDVEPVRREKLIMFLRSSAFELAGQAEQTKLSAEEIMAASKNIDDMVSEYERFSLDEKTSEDIDMLELLREVSAVAIKRCSTPVVVNLPQKTVFAHASRAITRQVLLNFFWNALDAMSEQAEEKRIDVGLSTEPNGTIAISVLDNGEGIEAANLEQLFKKRFSTRKHRLGGRGLYWCANAAKSAGWVIRAESKGKGEGAKLILSIPAVLHVAKDAA